MAAVVVGYPSMITVHQISSATDLSKVFGKMKSSRITNKQPNVSSTQQIYDKDTSTVNIRLSCPIVV